MLCLVLVLYILDITSNPKLIVTSNNKANKKATRFVTQSREDAKSFYASSFASSRLCVRQLFNAILGTSSLDSLEFRREVCFLCLPPSFLAVPHCIILAQLSVRTLSEPDSQIWVRAIAFTMQLVLERLEITL